MSRLAPYLPFVAIGLLLFVLLLGGRHLWSRGLARRPLLAAGALLGAAPLVYVLLVWGRLVPESYLRFGRPWTSALLFMAMSFAVVRLLGLRRAQSPLRTQLGDLWVVAALLAAGLGATAPELGRPLDRLTVIVAVDRSRSIDLVAHAEPRVHRELTAAETGMHDDDRIGTVVFGANAATQDPPRPHSALPAPQRVEIGRDSTDIGAAVRRALAEVPADSAARIVLVSDGVATHGDALGAAAAAVASEIPIDVLPLEQQQVPDLRLVSFRMTPRAHEQETLALRLVVSSPEATAVEIRISRDGELLRRLETDVAAGEEVLQITEPTPPAGLHRYDVALTAREGRLDATADNNSGSAFVRVRGAARALVLDGQPGRTRFVADALRAGGMQVDEGSQSSLPADVGGMASYDLVVMGDIPAPDLAPVQLEALASYVRDLGGGLLLTGGDRSLGPGGYSHTPLEEISPVSFDLKQERRRASLAEVIGIDISGSMAMTVGGQTKLELANEGAVQSADLLGAGDHLGVEHVDTAVNWSVPLGPVADKKAIERAIRAVSPGGGGIFVDVTLRDAYAALAKAPVNLKHVLLFADGADAENITAEVQSLVSDALRRGISTSVVALGQGTDVPALEEISRRGGGRFYIVEDAARLPAVFTQETILASRSAIVEEPFRVALGAGSAVTAGVDVGQAPPLGGYVVTIPKARASVLLTGPEQDPVLAHWPVGVGRAATFTSDLKDRWGQRWTGWDGAARLVAQLGRDLSRLEDDANVRLSAEAAAGQLALRADVTDDDGHTESFRRLKVVVSGPGGYRRELPLEAVGPGAYGVSLPLDRPGAYVAIALDEMSGKPVATTGAVLTAGEELRATGTDFALLGQLAELTGGKRRDTLAGIFADRAGRRFAYTDLTSLLLIIAAVALLFAVAARRLAIPEALERWARSLGRWRERRALRLAAVAATTTGDSTATLAALLRSKEDKQRDDARDAETRGASAVRPGSPTIGGGGSTGPKAAAGSEAGALAAAGPSAAASGPITADSTGPTVPDAAGRGMQELARRRATQQAPAGARDLNSASGGPPPPDAAWRPAPAAWDRPPTPSSPPPPSLRPPRSTPTPGADPTTGRRLTAAEILLARRKGKRG